MIELIECHPLKAGKPRPFHTRLYLFTTTEISSDSFKNESSSDN